MAQAGSIANDAFIEQKDSKTSSEQDAERDVQVIVDGSGATIGNQCENIEIGDEIESGTADSPQSVETTSNKCTTVSEEPPSGTALQDVKSGQSMCNVEHDEGANVKGDEHDEDGEPIPSGTGTVKRECSVSDLVGWSEILPKWHSKLSHRPRGLSQLVRSGIPDPLRGEVWQLLSGAEHCSSLMDQYRIFLTKSAPTEQIILRDVHRTYPAHENFRSGAGSSSLLDSLFKVCKAYAVYDEEVGYCQGLSFLVAALLLHMPEEQAFCVFARIMRHYGLRDLFRNNFDVLYLKFYQLEHLLDEHLPDLHQHFKSIGIEPFTYASQWFLTVFTAKFPLNAVFYIMDMFLLDGMDTIFQVALALLSSSKPELLALDFEGVLKYFRVQMPKRYQSQENVQQLIKVSRSFNLKKLNKYAKSYESIKQKEKLLENPLIRLQQENAKLTENILRLEQENDDIARDLVASKIQLRAQLDMLEDKAETLDRALTYSRQDCQSYLATISDIEDEKSRLEVEVSQLKEVCRRELNRAKSESARDLAIIGDYKSICSSLSKRLDEQSEQLLEFVSSCKDLLRDNSSCAERKCLELFDKKASSFVNQIKMMSSNSSSSSSSNNNNNNNNITSNHNVNSINEGDDKSQHTQASETASLSPSCSSTIQTSPDKTQMQRRDSSQSNSSGHPVGAYIKSTIDSQSTSSELKIKQLVEHVDELEVELARTKLALVEAECKCQQLSHDLNAGVTIKTSPSASQLDRTSQFGSLSSKLDSMKAAMTNRSRSPLVVPGSTLSKINNLISERISNMGSKNYPDSMPI